MTCASTEIRPTFNPNHYSRIKTKQYQSERVDRTLGPFILIQSSRLHVYV